MVWFFKVRPSYNKLDMEYPVIYLRIKDFDSEGRLVSDFFDKKIVLVFVHGDFCPHCTAVKADYVSAAKKNPLKKFVIFAAVQIDGEVSGEAECKNVLSKFLKEYRGVPDYATFYDKNPLKNFEVEGRNEDSLLRHVRAAAAAVM